METGERDLYKLADDFDTFLAHLPCFVEKDDEEMLEKVTLILRELARIETPLDRNALKPGADGRVHFADIVRANGDMAFEVLRNCREIASRGTNNG